MSNMIHSTFIKWYHCVGRAVRQDIPKVENVSNHYVTCGYNKGCDGIGFSPHNYHGQKNSWQQLNNAIIHHQFIFNFVSTVFSGFGLMTRTQNTVYVCSGTEEEFVNLKVKLLSGYSIQMSSFTHPQLVVVNLYEFLCSD